MEQNKQGTQTPEKQQNKKPENSGQDQQANSQNQQGPVQNKQGGGQNQHASKDSGFTPSSPSHSSKQGEDEKDDNRQQDVEEGSGASQRNKSGEGSDQDKTHGRDAGKQSGPVQQPG